MYVRMPDAVEEKNFMFVCFMTGKQLKSEWNEYINHYFLDDSDDDSQVPWPIEYFLYWIERNPELTFAVYELHTQLLPIH
jgi:hypothetical protein